METCGQKSASKRRHEVSVGPSAVPEKVLLLEAPREMERARFEALSDEHLRQQVWSYRLEVRNTREAMIESIIDHLQRNSPTTEVMGPPRPAVAEGSSEARPVAVPRDATAEVLEKLTAAITMCVQQQQLMWQTMAERLAGPLMPAPATSSGGGSTSGEVDSRVLGRPAPPRELAVSDDRRFCNAPLPVTVLMTQIPEYGGADADSVVMWTRRVDNVARIHQVSDGLIHLAATSRLSGAAKKWYDLQSGAVLESWRALKRELINLFDRRVPFYVAMREVEARMWLAGKETFRQYAIDKLALMHSLSLPSDDQVNLLIGGISNQTIRATVRP